MALFGVNLLATLRQRIGAVIGAFVASSACCLCGALMAFVFAPRQALRAVDFSRLPIMDAAAVESAAAGDTLLITGVLAGNAPLPETAALGAYRAEVFRVKTSPDDVDGPSEPFGSWTSSGSTVPELTLDMNGQAVQIHAAANIQLAGDLHEEVVPGSGLQAKYQGDLVADGTTRYQGLFDGELITVLGSKAASGGVNPQKLFGGDRAAFEASERGAASNFLISGICAMALAPVVLILGLLAAIFYRRR